MPVDTLSSSPVAETQERRPVSPVRYRRKRDPKVIAELNQKGHEIFSIGDEDGLPMRHKEKDVQRGEGEERSSNRPTSTSDGNYESLRYVVVGKMKLITLDQKEVDVEEAVLEFSNKKGELNPSMKIRPTDSRSKVKDFKIKILRDCSKIWFTERVAKVGIFLKEKLDVPIVDGSNEVLPIICIVWVRSLQDSTIFLRLSRIQIVLHELAKSRKTLHTTLTVLTNLTELELQRCIKSNMITELQKLSRAKRRLISSSSDGINDQDDVPNKGVSNTNNVSRKNGIRSLISKASKAAYNTGNGKSIRIPFSVNGANNRKISSTSQSVDPIPSSNFYSSSSPSGNTRSNSLNKRANEHKLSDHLLSNVKRTRKSMINGSNNSIKDPMSIDDEEIAFDEDKSNAEDELFYETPKIFEPNLVYKFTDGSYYTITNQDFKCLYNKDWINDSILDFFTKYFIESAITNNKVRKEDVHIMSSFFYTKLTSTEEEVYSNVKKWVNNTDLFKTKYVVIPINNNFHWFGCIITNLDSFFKYYNENKMSKNSKNLANMDREEDDITVSPPIITILTFDSLKQTHSREIDPIKEFLIGYAKDKYQLDIDKSLIKMKTCAVPQQANFSDCGVHVIFNIKGFFENPHQTVELWYSKKMKNKHDMRYINEYFNKSGRNNSRKFLRDILLSLQKQQVLHNAGIEANGQALSNVDEDEDIEIIEDLYDAKDSKLAPIDVKKNVNDIDIGRQSLSSRVGLQSEPPSPTPEFQEDQSIPSSSIMNVNSKAEEQGHIISNLSRSSHILASYKDSESNQVYTSPYFGKSILKDRVDNYTASTENAHSNSTYSNGHEKSNANNSGSPTMDIGVGENSEISADDFSERYNESDVNLIPEGVAPKSEQDEDALDLIRDSLARELNENIDTH